MISLMKFSIIGLLNINGWKILLNKRFNADSAIVTLFAFVSTQGKKCAIDASRVNRALSVFRK